MQKTKLRLRNVLENTSLIRWIKRRMILLLRSALYVALNIEYRIDYEMLKRHAVRHVVKSYAIDVKAYRLGGGRY